MTGCSHGDGPHACTNHPTPDPLGRTHCTVCGCFTASTDGRHGWCKHPRGTADYLERISAGLEGVRVSSHPALAPTFEVEQ